MFQPQASSIASLKCFVIKLQVLNTEALQHATKGRQIFHHIEPLLVPIKITMPVTSLASRMKS